MVVGTHSGTFHADDVLAFALIRSFVDAEATVLRTRDKAKLAECDIVIDVGGVFDASTRRFDHHQGSYTGPLSSAGMILDWLVQTGRITSDLGQHLRHRVVDYVDAVDTGRIAPKVDVPCFARIVEAYGQGCVGAEEQVDAFLGAADMAFHLVQGMVRGHARVVEARAAVKAAMDEAVATGCSVVFLDRYHPWKPVYFEFGGETHPTDYVVFPSEDLTWKVVAVPPTLGQFEQKRPLPAAWAGKMGEELSEAAGVPGAIFCHKNRFIAVFATRDALVTALTSHGLYDARPSPVLVPACEPATVAAERG